MAVGALVCGAVVGAAVVEVTWAALSVDWSWLACVWASIRLPLTLAAVGVQASRTASTTAASRRHGGMAPAERTWLTGARDRGQRTCPRCGALLQRVTTAGRTTVFCPREQP